MKEIEIIDKRKEREKHFLQENGNIIAHVYDDDVHFFKDGEYVEIDNTLVDDDEYYTNTDNAYKVWFNKNSQQDIMQMEVDNHYINIKLKEGNNVDLLKNEDDSKISSSVCYREILTNIDFDYKVLSNQVKECIILKERNADIDKLEFVVDTDLELSVNENKSISCFNNGIEVFKIEAPYMMDSENNINNNVNYELIRENEVYLLKLLLDEEWLNFETTIYPIIIDPTITNSGQTNSVYDTYIYPNDTNVDRNNREYFKVGVERQNNSDVINRALLKFELPVIATGSQVIDAKLVLRGYPDTTGNHTDTILNIHRVTENWTESGANWNNMNNKYDQRVEGVFYSTRDYVYSEGGIMPFMAEADLTNLVKKWYSDTTNYGILIKANKEIYNNSTVPMFFSKNNSVSGTNPKPLLTVTYRNQNGLEKYMDYISQTFSQGKMYQNKYNGNMTGIFNIGSTIGGKMPIDLKWIYNTNDIVLNQNIGYGKGGRLNLSQTISPATEIVEENVEYLKYVDEDGTIHYFLNQRVAYDENGSSGSQFVTTNYTNKFFDEDGLDLTIERNSNNYILKDKNGNQKVFNISNGIGHLSQIIDLSGNVISITYDTNYKIIKITDPNNSEINIVYTSNAITVNSPSEIVTLNLNNSCISSIVSLQGTTLFTNSSNNLISSIQDINGKKISYEYNEQIPYRVKKVSEYGINNQLGNYFNIIYGYNATTIIDNKNLTQTTTFNDYGNPVSRSNLKNENDLINAYGIKLDYGQTFRGVTTTTNKLLSNQIPIKFVKNYIPDSSFENMEEIFLCGDRSHAVSSMDYAHTGKRSLKFQSSLPIDCAYTRLNVPKGKYYTLSLYVKPLYQPMYLELSYYKPNDQRVCVIGEEIYPENQYSNVGDFKRHELTIFYSEDAVSELTIALCGTSTFYVDDIQLEEGEVANEYNMIENADFQNGITGWQLFATDENNNDVSNNVFEVVNVTDDIKALKIKMNPANNSSATQTFNVSGNIGDKYTLSFWYKNEGFKGNILGVLGDMTRNNIMLSFNPVVEQQTDFSPTVAAFNANEKEWQYFSQTFEAPWDFNGIAVDFWQSLNANNLYITNINLFKDVRDVTYEYDENGNIIKSKNLANEINIFNYDKNNQLVSTLQPNGKNFTYEYDNVIKDRIIRGVSGTGISNEVEYDSFGNVKTTRIINRGQNSSIENGIYNIRLKGTNKSIRLVEQSIKIQDNDCGHDKWIIEKQIINNIDYFKIKHYIINKYLTINDSNQLVFDANQGDKSLFKFVKNEDGTYLIQNKYNSKYLKYGSSIGFVNLVDNDDNFKFYFEANATNKFIENNIEYTDDGKFITNTIDSNFNKYCYDIDSITGLISSVTNPNGKTIYYTYNNKKQLTSIVDDQKVVSYEYNNQNLLSKIIQDGREYNFNYDEFLNISNIKIGDDIVLVNNIYSESNGNLTSSTYGNSDIISFVYDEFDRIKEVIKMNNTYKYYYGNNGDLLKIKSDNDETKFVYDSSKNLCQYIFNQFEIKYGYDSNGNVIDKNYKLGDKKYSVQNLLNNDDSIIQANFDNNNINYNYDSLGRLEDKNINNNYSTSYEYVDNGNKTSLLVRSINNNNDKYSYKYDKLNNITHIYHNNNLENRYYYDNYNQLIKENNYILNETIRYKYDNLGNILYKKICKLGTYDQLSQNKYEYNNNNWKDQLTKFDDETITYDAIGNPTTIGSNITLNWINGRQLNRYIAPNVQVTYKYNEAGIRIGKTVSGIETKYYVEGNNIVLEKTGNDMLYFKRVNNELIGFDYNNISYYYLKNLQNDIIGILDNNYNVIARYTYDSWGNILSIKDSNNNDVSNNMNHIANINPFRYRCYYYDKETGLYYLNSRYYNSIWGRFINADSIINSNNDILSNNLYLYCSNNPINRIDSCGNGWISNVWNGMKKLGSQIVTVVKNTANIVVNTARAIKNAFVLDVGLGVGADIGSNVGELGYYNDKTFKIENGQTKTGNSVGLTAKFKPTSVGIGNEFFHQPHYVDGDFEESINHSQFMPLMTHIANCPETESSFSINVKPTDTTIVEYNNVSTYFIGIDLSSHIGVGGHIKIGFNIQWDWNSN